MRGGRRSKVVGRRRGGKGEGKGAGGEGRGSGKGGREWEEGGREVGCEGETKDINEGKCKGEVKVHRVVFSAEDAKCR